MKPLLSKINCCNSLKLKLKVAIQGNDLNISNWIKFGNRCLNCLNFPYHTFKSAVRCSSFFLNYFIYNIRECTQNDDWKVKFGQQKFIIDQNSIRTLKAVKFSRIFWQRALQRVFHWSPILAKSNFLCRSLYGSNWRNIDIQPVCNVWNFSLSKQYIH